MVIQQSFNAKFFIIISPILIIVRYTSKVKAKKRTLMTNIFSVFFLGICLGLSQSQKNVVGLDKRVLLNIYHLETSSACLPQWRLYDFVRSVGITFNYVRSLVALPIRRVFLPISMVQGFQGVPYKKRIDRFSLVNTLKILR